MSYGSNGAVEDAENDYKEQCAQLIAKTAAALVAARDMPRSDAIKAATDWVRQEIEAVGDVTQVASIENEFPEPSLAAPRKQLNAIELALLDAAREAADTL